MRRPRTEPPSTTMTSVPQLLTTIALLCFVSWTQTVAVSSLTLRQEDYATIPTGMQQQSDEERKEAAVRLITSLQAIGKAAELMNDLRIVLDGMLQPHEILEAIAVSATATTAETIPTDSTTEMLLMRTITMAQNSSSLPKAPTTTSVPQSKSLHKHHKKDKDNNNNNNNDFDDKYYADRHYKGLLSAATDYDCMERDFDVTDPLYDVEEARKVLSKCRLLVLRNVFSPEQILAFKEKFANFLGDIFTGKTPSSGRTTLNEKAFLVERGDRRYECILPPPLADPAIVANDVLMDLLGHEQMLGSRMIARAVGANLAEAGSNGQGWHNDEYYLFGGNSFQEFGVGGHDLPPAAITMTTPLVESLTYNHGPTEFCLGSSYVQGLDQRDNLKVRDPRLLEQYGPLDEFNFWMGQGVCPPGHWRAPLAKLGDVVLFDFSILHRGGPNSSPELRAMLYAIYSRKWFHDTNFDLEHLDGVQYDQLSRQQKLMEITRLAVIDQPSSEQLPQQQQPHHHQQQKLTGPEEESDKPFSVENITHLFPPVLYQSELERDYVRFFLTNVDIDEGIEVVVLEHEDADEEEVILLEEAGESIELEVPIGTLLSLHSIHDGTELFTWQVRLDQTQIVITNELLGMTHQ